MTTTLQTVTGATSKQSQHIQPKIEPLSPVPNLPQKQDMDTQDEPSIGVSKPGLSVGENGQVVKVPAFLNKLFNMVSDADTDELIYWADSGDSFFVPNHERLGKELLPRFFKHGNFSSFVRQLNMYGFHKVPHLQSGVLKNEAPSELWEFVNPFFKRDKPELLVRVTRKNNRPAQAPPPSTGSTGSRSSARQAAANAQGGTGFPGVPLLTDGTTEGEVEVGPLVPASQLADLHAIQNGINAIRQTQAAIGADLKALQASNEHLWREALESRERAQKHEETIDLIVSFLERLFGTEGEGLKGLKEAMRRGGLSRNRSNEAAGEEEASSKKRRRLMIEDGRGGSGSGSSRLVEIQEPSSASGLSSATIEPYVTTAPPSSSTSRSDDPWNSSGPRFTSLPTDEDGVSPRIFTPGNSIKTTSSAEQTLHQTAISPLSDGVPEIGTGVNGQQTTPITTYAPNNYQNALAPYVANGNVSGFNPTDTMLDQLIRSPATAELLLNTLNASSTQGQTLPSMADGSKDSTGLNSTLTDPSMQLFSPMLPNHQALLNNSNDLLSAYQRADGLSQNVNQMQEQVDAFVRDIGLTPRHEPGARTGSAANQSASGPASNATTNATGSMASTAQAPAAPGAPSTTTEPEPISIPDGVLDTHYEFYFEPQSDGQTDEEG